MRPIYRMSLAALALAAASITAHAQQNTTPPNSTNLRDWFTSNPNQSATNNWSPGMPNPVNFGNPNPPGRNAARVRPVPEPSQWALMATGVGLVAWIVRRRSKRNKD